MDTILCLIHTEADGTVGRAAREALSLSAETAAKLGTSWTAALVGADVSGAANAIASAGAAKILGAAGADFASARYATDAAAAEALIKASGATLVIAPATSRWQRALPGAAYRAGGRIDTRVTGVSADGGLKVQRWYYRQRMMATLARTQRPWVILVESGVAKPWEGAAGAAAVEAVAVPVTDAMKRTKVTGLEKATTGAQTIKPDAKVLLVAGAGWTKKQADGATHVKEAEELILEFLDLAGASLGSSKSLVDQSGEGQEVLSCLTHLNQVGQTGATPRHPKGLSTCCHGEEPHVVGWRFVNERRAVNLDPACGWAQGKADVLYVADAFAVMKKVNEILQ